MSELTIWTARLGAQLNKNDGVKVESTIMNYPNFTMLESHKIKLLKNFPEIYNKFFTKVEVSSKVSSDEILCRKYLNKLSNARTRGIEFELSLTSLKNIMRAKKCYYSGVALNLDNSTIDRVDSSLGYIKGNVVACHTEVNSLKSIFENKCPLESRQLKRMLIKWSDGL
tara:strand:+ start:630 stop:1136 length:507 start_codon:yes stop_codon:yes gene_type:complete